MRKKRAKAQPTLDQRVRAELSPDSVLCPLCASDWVIEGTAGYKYGVCSHCYMKAKNAALDAYAKDGVLKRDNDMARKRKSRAEQAGEIPKRRAQIPPDFDLLREL